MNHATWAVRNGFVLVTASRWLRAGLLPVPAHRVGRSHIPVDQVVTEVGSALNGHRRKFLAVLRDPGRRRADRG